ncbi:Os01g0791151 [Oryza sativa Japonica Group]|uniref:Os01g0791151 protein n=1 Tax=Oryza sativa subsp. japonica TaxID=39947 RepID=A0A0P0V944_ORYSJ|nr:hypothetical protein EE612_006198 [Oryza sativa]BAS74723.1 Os01g0791151 [Oryza sativa Japonica Group]
MILLLGKKRERRDDVADHRPVAGILLQAHGGDRESLVKPLEGEFLFQQRVSQSHESLLVLDESELLTHWTRTCSCVGLEVSIARLPVMISSSTTPKL